MQYFVIARFGPLFLFSCFANIQRQSEFYVLLIYYHHL